MRRTTSTLEKKLWKEGFFLVAGIDEVGMGPWAGPVVAAAVILKDGRDEKKHKFIPYIRDSKTLTAKARENIFTSILTSSVAWSVGMVSASLVDRYGIREAHRRAVLHAIRGLSVRPHMVLFDAFAYATSFPSRAVPRGDDRIRCIAAASIVAKVIRDRFMERVHCDDGRYGFAQHKGYGTRAHERALRQHGLSPWHRKTFVPTRCLPPRRRQ